MSLEKQRKQCTYAVAYLQNLYCKVQSFWKHSVSTNYWCRDVKVHDKDSKQPRYDMKACMGGVATCFHRCMRSMRTWKNEVSNIRPRLRPTENRPLDNGTSRVFVCNGHSLVRTKVQVRQACQQHQHQMTHVETCTLELVVPNLHRSQKRTG